MPAMESRVEGLWVAKQTAKGTPAITAVKQGAKVGGDIHLQPTHGSEAYSDGNRFTSAADYMNELIGNGNPVVQGQPGILAYLFYLMCGQETVTGAADPYQHVATPNNSGSFWTTWWKKVGATVGPLRQKFNDCKLQSLAVEASSASKVVHLTPTFVSLDPGYTFAVDPTPTIEVDLPFLYTEGTSRYTIAGVPFRGQSSIAFTINDNVTPHYGDDVTADDVAFGQGTVEITGLTLLMNQQGYDFYCEKFYGMTNPPDGTPPLKTVPPLDTYALDLQRGSAGLATAGDRQFKVEFPGIHWTPDMAVAGNPAGGAMEVSLSAQTRPTTGNPHIRVTTKNADPAYT